MIKYIKYFSLETILKTKGTSMFYKTRHLHQRTKMHDLLSCDNFKLQWLVVVNPFSSHFTLKQNIK